MTNNNTAKLTARARAEAPALQAEVHEAKLLNCSNLPVNPIGILLTSPSWALFSEVISKLEISNKILQTANNRRCSGAACAAAAEMKSSVCMNIRITRRDVANAEPGE